MTGFRLFRRCAVLLLREIQCDGHSSPTLSSHRAFACFPLRCLAAAAQSVRRTQFPNVIFSSGFRLFSVALSGCCGAISTTDTVPQRYLLIRLSSVSRCARPAAAAQSVRRTQFLSVIFSSGFRLFPAVGFRKKQYSGITICKRMIRNINDKDKQIYAATFLGLSTNRGPLWGHTSHNALRERI